MALQAIGSGEPVADHGAKGGDVFCGRYRIVRSLKKGQGIETLLAEGGEHGRVIIKRATGDQLSLGARMRLEHEAQVLRDIRSPWFAPLLEMGQDNDGVYLVVPFIAGITL